MRKPLVVAAAAGAASAGLALAGPALALTIGAPVKVSLSEFNVVTAAQAAAHGSVTFTVANRGKLEHEFVVLKTAKPAGSLASHNGEASEAGNVGEIGSVKPGQTKTLTLKLAAGHYSLLCNLPGHYAGGQFIDFYVR